MAGRTHNVRKSRLGSKKSSTGCINCKIRRVKRDEAKTEDISSHDHAMAFQAYCRSITALKARLDRGITWSTICNIASILYTCVECLQQNSKTVSSIYQRALRAVHGTDRPWSHSAASVEDAAKAFLHHMAASRGQLPRGLVKRVNTTNKLAWFRQARDALYYLIAEAHEYVCHVENVKLRQAKIWLAPSVILNRSSLIITKLRRWYSVLIATEPCGCELEDQARTVGILAYLQFYVYVFALPSMYETACDEYFDKFQNMVYHTFHIVQTSDLHPLFSFEISLVPFLSFVATKCRHLQIRWQTVSLLRAGPMIVKIA